MDCARMQAGTSLSDQHAHARLVLALGTKRETVFDGVAKKGVRRGDM